MDGIVLLAAQNIVVAAFLTFFVVIIPTIAIVTASETKR